MHNETFSNQKVAAKVTKEFTALKIDGRKHGDLAKRLKIKLYPTTAFVHPNGKIMDVIHGFKGPQDFLQRLGHIEKKMVQETKLLATKPTQAAAK